MSSSSAGLRLQPIFSRKYVQRTASSAGLALSKYIADRPNEFLVCVTETMPKAEIDRLVDALTASR
jgi:glycine cleavage system pyridoxal-binding protein P